MSINYEATYNQGIEAGERLYARSPNCLPPQLRKEAEVETAMQDLPMVLQAHFKDGLIAGYEAMRPKTAEKRQS